MPRYIIVIDPSIQPFGKACAAIARNGIDVVEEMAMLNTLVVTGPSDRVRSLPENVSAIVSIEEEGEVSAQDD